MKAYWITIFSFFTLIAFGQNLSYSWSQIIGSGNGAVASCTALTTDSNGNVYACGKYNGSMSFGSDSAYAIMHGSNPTGFLIKYDSLGKVIWANNFFIYGQHEINQVYVDNDGNVLTCGYYTQRIDLDGGRQIEYDLFGSRYKNGFVAKYDSIGNLLWGINLTNNNDNYVNNICTDHDNNVYITGGFSGSVDFDNSADTALLSAQSRLDAFIAKYNKNGQHIWSFNIASNGDDYGQNIIVNNSQQLIVSGAYAGQGNFAKGSKNYNLTPNGGMDVFLAKYSLDGAVDWVKTIGGTANDYPTDLKVSKGNSLFISGYFEGTADFDPESSSLNITSIGDDDIFIAKYDSVGRVLWAHGFGSTRADVSTALAVDSNANCYIVGNFKDSIDFDPSNAKHILKSHYNGDMFLSSFDSVGNFRSAFNIGNNNKSSVNTVATDHFGNIITGGLYLDSIDFDPDTSVYTNQDITAPISNAFIAKYNQDSLSLNDVWLTKSLKGGSDYVTDLIHDSFGNIIVLGRFEGDVKFGKGKNKVILNAIGEQDIYVAKYDTLGNLHWAISIGGLLNEEPRNISVDKAGNVFVLSLTKSDSIDLDPRANKTYFVQSKKGTKPNGTLIAKYSVQGEFEWGYSFSRDIHYYIGENLVIDENQDVWLSGNFWNTVDFDPGLGETKLRSNGTDGFLLKFSNKGKFRFVKQIGSEELDGPQSVASSQKNGIYQAGIFIDSCDVDPSSNVHMLRSTDPYGYYLAKYDTLGQFIWAKQFSGSTYWSAIDLKIDQNENLYMIGDYRDSINFKDTTLKASYASYIVSFNSRSQLRWAYTPVARINSIDVLDSLIYLYGSFTGTVDFDPSPTSSATLTTVNNIYNSCSYVLRLDTLNNFRSVNRLILGGKITALKTGLATGATHSISFDLSVDTFREHYFRGRGGSDGWIAYYSFKTPCKTSYSNTNITACNPYKLPSGRWINKSGYYIDSGKTKSGCDTILMANIKLKEQSFNTIDTTVCHSYRAPSGKVIRVSGNHTDTITNYLGCDSILTIKLIILNPYTSRTYNICDTLISPSSKYHYTKPGAYWDTLPISGSCDSLIQLIIKDGNTKSNLVASTCSTYTSPSGKYMYSKGGTYSDTLINQIGCDSIITIKLSIDTPIDSTISIFACEKYLSPSGKTTITKSGQYLDTIKAINGCDSLVIINAIISNSKNAVLKVSNCDSLISPSGRFVYQNSGQYIDTIPTVMGCDSIINIEFTRLIASESNLNIAKCNGYMSPSGKYFYNRSGLFKDTLTNKVGCDSIITIDFTLLDTTYSTIDTSACYGIWLPSGNRFVTQSGFYKDTLRNTAGCDSFIYLRVNILSIDSTITFINDTLIANDTSAEYQWLDCNKNYAPIFGATARKFRPENDGKYAVELYNGYCSNTSGCYLLDRSSTEPVFKAKTLIYPNPTSNMIYVNSNTQIKGLRVYTIQGQVLIEVKNESELLVKELAPSIYFIEVETSSGIERFRFVKE